jgi:putative hydrolase of the HAD superfamily
VLRALLFDLDGTLIDRDAAHARWAREVAPLGGWRELIAADQHGYRSRTDYFAWVARTRPELGDAQSLWERYRRRLPELLTPPPGVAALLERLRRRYALGLVSNGGRVTQRRKLARAGLTRFFPRPVISAEVGAAKPASLPFELGLRELGLPASSALFVGDDPRRDVEGGRAAGLRTCWVSHGRLWPAELPSPDLVVADVLELEGVL